MTRGLLAAAFLLVSLGNAEPRSVSTRLVSDPENEKPALDLFNIDASYIFESKLSRGNINLGDQDVFQTSIDYAHRFHLTGLIYLRAGVSYGRFDFGQSSSAPVPDELQSVAGIIGLDYMVGKDQGAFLDVRPGFYTQHDFDRASFDAPITLARFWVLQDQKLYLLTGANYAFLRGEYPVLPVVGLVWYPSEKWAVLAIMPEPRVTYLPNKKLGLWLGGQLTGGSFRTDQNPTILPRQLSGAQVDYSEYRAAAGVDFHCNDAITFTVAGGMAFQRRINFDRAGVEFKTDAAPYVRAMLKMGF